MSVSGPSIVFAGYGPDSRKVRPYVEEFEKVVESIADSPEWVDWWRRCAGEEPPLVVMVFFDEPQGRPSVRRRKDGIHLTLTREPGGMPKESSECARLAETDVMSGLLVVATRFGVPLPAGHQADPAWVVDDVPDDEAGGLELRLPLHAMPGEVADELLEALEEALEEVGEVDDFEEEGDEWVMPLEGDVDAVLQVLRALAADGEWPLSEAYVTVYSPDVREQPRRVALVEGR
ncbi:MAG: hypothetical protein U0Q15_14525 [Kineosporiaceae bacterium]